MRAWLQRLQRRTVSVCPILSHLIIPISSTDAQIFSSLFLSHHLPSSTLQHFSIPSPLSFLVARSAPSKYHHVSATLSFPASSPRRLNLALCHPRVSYTSHIVSLAPLPCAAPFFPLSFCPVALLNTRSSSRLPSPARLPLKISPRRCYHHCRRHYPSSLHHRRPHQIHHRCTPSLPQVP